MKWSENIDEIAAALAEAQAELTSPKKTKTAKIRSKKGADSSFEYKFADLESGLKIIRETLPKHKLAFTQGTELRGNSIVLQTMLLHASGQWMISDYPVCEAQGDHKSIGASMTYAKRHALFAALGITGDDDHDADGGASATGEYRNMGPGGFGKDIVQNGGPAHERQTAHALKKTDAWDEAVSDLDMISSEQGLKDWKTQGRKEFENWPLAWRKELNELYDARLAELKDQGFDGSSDQ